MINSTNESPLDAIQNYFRGLVEAGTLPTLDAWTVGAGHAQRHLDVNHVKSLLSKRDTDQSVRDAIWAEIVKNAQVASQPWILYATGLMTNGLRYTAKRVLSQRGGDVSDVESEVLVGFVEALRSIDPHIRKLSSHLKQMAYYRATSAHQTTRPRTTQGLEQSSTDILRPVPLITPPGHPDLVLAQAVIDNVLTPIEADIIASTRLEGISIVSVARHLNLPVPECAGRRDRAESTLFNYLRPCSQSTKTNNSRQIWQNSKIA